MRISITEMGATTSVPTFSAKTYTAMDYYTQVEGLEWDEAEEAVQRVVGDRPLRIKPSYVVLYFGEQIVRSWETYSPVWQEEYLESFVAEKMQDVFQMMEERNSESDR